MMIERVKAEGVIDVFQTVQAMRLQRPAMVQTAVRNANVKLAYPEQERFFNERKLDRSPTFLENKFRGGLVIAV